MEIICALGSLVIEGEMKCKEWVEKGTTPTTTGEYSTLLILLCLLWVRERTRVVERVFGALLKYDKISQWQRLIKFRQIWGLFCCWQAGWLTRDLHVEQARRGRENC